MEAAKNAVHSFLGHGSENPTGEGTTQQSSTGPTGEHAPVHHETTNPTSSSDPTSSGVGTGDNTAGTGLTSTGPTNTGTGPTNTRPTNTGTDPTSTGPTSTGAGTTGSDTTGPTTTGSDTTGLTKTGTDDTSSSHHKHHHLLPHKSDKSDSKEDIDPVAAKEGPQPGPDPALVGDVKTTKLTGSGTDGSHSAVFGLTPDGHKHTDTTHGSTPIKPAHSAKTTVSKEERGDANDDSSRAPTGQGVSEQLHKDDRGPKGLERTDPAPVDHDASGDGKPGAGLTGLQQGSGQVGN